VRERGFFDEFKEEHESRRRGAPFFDDSGKATPAARSGFGKLFARFDGRIFTLDARAPIRFSLSGRGDRRLYVFERASQ